MSKCVLIYRSRDHCDATAGSWLDPAPALAREQPGEVFPDRPFYTHGSNIERVGSTVVDGARVTRGRAAPRAPRVAAAAAGSIPAAPTKTPYKINYLQARFSASAT